MAERTNLKIGDEIEVRSTQGTNDEFYKLKIVGLVDEQAYFFQPTIFVPAATWELVRPQPESDLNSDTPYPNIVAVKLDDPTQVEAMKLRLLNEVSNIEVADIETTINNIPGYTAQQGTVQTQAVFTLLIGILGDRRFLPNSDPAKGPADRRIKGDRLFEFRSWTFCCDPDHGSDCHRCWDWSDLELSVLTCFASQYSAGIQWDTLFDRHLIAFVHRPVWRHGLHYLRRAH